jgi:phosphoglycolate phosphatase-like HAD superfamily hydrolase
MNAPTPHRQVFALDFDGVICESLEEALLISWNAHTRAPVDAFARPGLAGVPPEIRDRFTRCRPFARHFGHWVVPFTIGSVPASRAEFAARYDEVPAQIVATFTAAATDYRAQVRRAYEDLWLAHHRVQPGLGELLGDAYIVTARDAGAVSQILDAHAVGIDDIRIFGSRSDKQDALRIIASRELVASADVTLVDDSIENCVAAQAAGYSAWWATWGYNVVADQALARTHRIKAVSIDDFRQLLTSRSL